MTDATKLADALVEAGIGEKHDDSYYIPMGYTQICYDAHGFITDWRVAGTVLESMDTDLLWKLTRKTVNFLVDPRAIIEAWYAAVEGEGDD